MFCGSKPFCIYFHFQECCNSQAHHNLHWLHDVGVFTCANEKENDTQTLLLPSGALLRDNSDGPASLRALLQEQASELEHVIFNHLLYKFHCLFLKTEVYGLMKGSLQTCGSFSMYNNSIASVSVSCLHCRIL